MVKKAGKHVIVDDEEVDKIRRYLHDDAQELFACSLKGGIFGVYLDKGFPFYFISKQMLLQYQCTLDSFLKEYPDGFISTIWQEERELYEHDLLQTIENHELFDRVCKTYHNDKIQYMRDIAKLATLEDGTKIILILRSNVTDVFEQQLKLEQDALFYAEQNKKMEELTAKIPCAVCMLIIGEHFSLHFANDEFYYLLKYTEQQLREEKHDYIDELIYDQDIDWLREKINQAINNKDKEIKLENRIVCRDGTVIWLLVKGYFTYHKDSAEMICSFMDITKRKKTEEDVKISEERFRVALAITDSTIFEYDISTKTMIHGDRSAVAYGIQHFTENVPESLLESGVVHPKSADEFLRMYREICEGATTASCLVRTRLVENGSFVWRKIVMTNIFDDEGRPVQAVGVLEDVDEQVKREERLIYETERDALTGLYNRRFMVSSIDKELQRDDNNGLKAILIIDIDDFKKVNDTKGHLFGDYVLTETAKRISIQYSKEAYVGRIGGDEFIAYYLHAENIEQIQAYAQHIVESFNEEYKSHGNQIKITCSVGYAVYPNDGDNFEKLYQNADTALYVAKQSGKNKVVGYQSLNNK